MPAPVFRYNVKGLKELDAQLRELSQGMAAKVMARAAKRAFQPVLDAAIARVPVDSGLTRDSIRIRVVKPPDSNSPWCVVGLVIIVGKGGNKAVLKGLRGSVKQAAIRKSAHWRWRFIEKGTRHQPATPFLRPALDNNAAATLELLRVELSREIDKLVKPKGGRG